MINLELTLGLEVDSVDGTPTDHNNALFRVEEKLVEVRDITKAKLRTLLIAFKDHSGHNFRNAGSACGLHRPEATE